MFRLWEGGGTGQRSYLPGPAMRGACKPGTLQPASALQTLGGGQAWPGAVREEPQDPGGFSYILRARTERAADSFHGFSK